MNNDDIYSPERIDLKNNKEKIIHKKKINQRLCYAFAFLLSQLLLIS